MEIRECPVSFIVPESVELVQHYFRARSVHEAFGASLYGSDLSEWPAWAVYMTAALEEERIKYQNAVNKLRD